VKFVGKFAVLTLTVSLFAAPLMACLVSANTMSAEERECCRQMAGDCGKMPASHSCCKTVVKDSDPYLSTSPVQISLHSHFAVFVLPAIDLSSVQDASFDPVYSDAHAPPESLPAKTSILRI
jgi:hypothetical protein